MAFCWTQKSLFGIFIFLYALHHRQVRHWGPIHGYLYHFHQHLSGNRKRYYHVHYYFHHIPHKNCIIYQIVLKIAFSNNPTLQSTFSSSPLKACSLLWVGSLVPLFAAFESFLSLSIFWQPEIFKILWVKKLKFLKILTHKSRNFDSQNLNE